MIKNANKIFLTFTTFLLISQNIFAAEFRHKNITVPKKTAKYGFMNAGYTTGFTANNIYGLGLQTNSQFFTQVESYLKTNNPSALTDPLSFKGQNVAINLGFGYKPNSPFRFDFVVSYIQGRNIIVPNSITLTLDVPSSAGGTISQNIGLSTVDIVARQASAIFNVYLDSDFSILRNYVGVGVGPAILNAVMRGNQEIGQALSTDVLTTKQRYNNFAIVGNIMFGSQILVSKAIAIDICYKRIFNMLSFNTQTANVNGKSITTKNPASYTIQMITGGVVFYF